MMAVLMGEVKVTGHTSQALKLSSLQPILNQARDRAAKAAASDLSTRCKAAPGAEDDQDGHEAPVKMLSVDESPLSLVGGDHYYQHRRDRLDSASNASDDGRSSDSDSDADDVLILQSERDRDGRRAKAAGAELPPELNLLDTGAMEAIGFDCGQCIPQAWIDDDDDDVSIG
jgi:hypothetical protein